MNFLAHLHLSGPDPAIMTGNFMGDFVKGRIGPLWPPGLRDGLILHRRIDSFVQQHELVLVSRNRLASHYGLYRGVLLDLFYDHFLAVDWGFYADEDLTDFLLRSRNSVEGYRSWLPPRLVTLLPLIYEEMIPSYATVDGVAEALRRMARRVARRNPLEGAEIELRRLYDELRHDFRQLLPVLQGFAEDQREGFASCP